MLSAVACRQAAQALARHWQQPLRTGAGRTAAGSLWKGTRAQSTQPLKVPEKLSLLEKAKRMARKYIDGTKLLYRNVVAARTLRHRRASGQPLSYSEDLLLATTATDIKKVYPFLAMYIFLPEALPFVIYRFPSFLPSTYESADEAAQRWAVLDRRRAEDTLAVLKGPGQTPAEQTYRRLMAAAVGPASLTSACHEAATVLGDGGVPMDQLGKPWLAPLCHSLAQTASLPAPMLRNRITKRLEEIAADDSLLRQHGVAALSPSELLRALHMRGLPVPNEGPASTEAMQAHLAEWLGLAATTPLPLLAAVVAARAAAAHSTHGPEVSALLQQQPPAQ